MDITCSRESELAIKFIVQGDLGDDNLLIGI